MGVLEYCAGRELFQLLVKNEDARSVVEEWVERRIETDLRIRKAKTRGYRVIETTDILFAKYVMTHYRDCKINIKQI